MSDVRDVTQHISQRFNAELRHLHNQVLGMGGLVEEQLANAITALTEGDEQLAKKVYNNDYTINALEVSIDEECTQVIVRRQPAASDLRLIMAVIKTINDLERIGDEAENIARMSIKITGLSQKHYVSFVHLSERVREVLHGALDAFARSDTDEAVGVIRSTFKIDDEYESLARQLMTYMMEDQRMIPVILNLLGSARALERIAAHTRNVCENIIYFAKGTDVRHISLEQLEEQTREQ